MFMKTDAMWRFYAIVALFFTFVFMSIPRVDFFLCAILFLLVFISIFYFDNAALLKKMLRFYLGGSLILLLFFAAGLASSLSETLPYAADTLTLIFIIAYGVYTRKLVAADDALRRKYRLTLILAIAAPLIIGSIFKFLLLVPMPTEGMVALALDAAWYSVF